MFSASKLQKECNDTKLRVRRYGPRRAELIRRRLDELRAADVLEDIRHLPGPRCHELKADRDGQLSVDLDHPYRLIFEPANDPIPCKLDGGLDWSQVTAVRILEVTDTHG
jgi:proteic killer suppression protein